MRPVMKATNLKIKTIEYLDQRIVKPILKRCQNGMNR